MQIAEAARGIGRDGRRERARGHKTNVRYAKDDIYHDKALRGRSPICGESFSNLYEVMRCNKKYILQSVDMHP